MLLIFDNVKDLTFIMTQYKKYEFTFIYILDSDKNCNNVVHKVSEFGVTHIPALQEKILYIYPLIAELNESQSKVLHKLTDGNINKIVTMLSSKQYIDWIIDINEKKQTEYDILLQSIEIELFCGHYKKAKEELQEFNKNNENEIKLNADLYFKYTLIKSDCEHLLNNYSDAKDIITTLNSNSEFNKNFTLQLSLAHYYKHLWKSNDALKILEDIYGKTNAAIVDSFGILLSQYFINGTANKHDYPNSLKSFLDLFVYLDSNNLSPISSDCAKKERYKVYYNYYSSSNPDYDEIIVLADNLIKEYRESGNRLLANAYVLRGEINRLFEKYDFAEIDYEQSLLATDDRNIYTQVHLMRYYISSIKKKNFKRKLPLHTKQELVKLCDNNKYNDILFSLINSIELQDENASKIIKNFDEKIMIIL